MAQAIQNGDWMKPLPGIIREMEAEIAMVIVFLLGLFMGVLLGSLLLKP